MDSEAEIGSGPDKIVLVGYRACGKTSVGRELAAGLNWDFLDMDVEISRRAGATIREMVAEQGWDYFRSRERELLRELPGCRQLVVATGGGAVLHRELWPELKKKSLVVWLAAGAATIAARLSADTASGEQRPALTEKGLLEEVSSLLRQREEFYRQAADLRIDTTRLEPAAVAALIIERWRQLDDGRTRQNGSKQGNDAHGR